MSSGPDMQTLVREAKANGVPVRRTNGGHYKFKAPDGTPIFAGTTPGSDGESAKQVRADLKAHGYSGPTPNLKDTRRQKAGRAETKNAELAVRILGRLQLHPGQSFRPSDLAKEFERPLKDCANALASLKRSHPEIVNPERGVWMYSVDPLRAPIVTRKEGQAPKPAPKVRNWGAKGKIVDYLKQHPRAVLTTDAIAGDLGLAPATCRQALYLLQIEVFKDDLEKPGRGRWRYNPKEMSEADKLRAKLSMVEHELEKKDVNSLPPLLRRLLHEEEERLKNRLENPHPVVDLRPLAEPAIEPVTVVAVPDEIAAPITVMPMKELPADCPALFEAVTIHRNGGVVMKDETGELWLAHHIKIQFPS